MTLHAMGPLSLLALASAVAVIGLGLYPLLSRESLQESLFFFLFCLAVAVWLSGFGLMFAAPDEEEAFRWLRFAYVGVPFIPAAIYTVSVHSLGVAEERRRALGVLWSAAGFFLLLMVGTDVVVEGLYRYDWGFYPEYSAAGAGVVVYVTAGVAAALTEYMNRFRTADRLEERERAKRYLLAFGVGSLALVDFLPCYGVAVPPTGPVVIPVMAVMIGHTIRRYQLTELTSAYAADRVLETMTNPVLVVGDGGTIRVTNPAASRVLNYGNEDLEGRMVEEAAPIISSEEGLSWSKLLQEEGKQSLDVELEARDGERVPALLSTSPMYDSSDRRVGTVAVIRDIRERRDLEYRALHDPLTDLPNRTLFHDRLEQALRRAERAGLRVAVLYVDLDGFKSINDSLGHPAGDRVLRLIADRLEETLREQDTVARIGGDEFCVLLENAPSSSDIERAAARIHGTLRSPFELEEESFRISASMGAAHSEMGEGTPADLIHRADAAMYRAKEEGSGQIRIFDPEIDG